MPDQNHYDRKAEELDRALASDPEISDEAYIDICEMIAGRFESAANAKREELERRSSEPAPAPETDEAFDNPHHGHEDENAELDAELDRQLEKND